MKNVLRSGFKLFDDEDKENLFELAESIKQKHGLKNIKIHYEDLPAPYWYIEVLN